MESKIVNVFWNFNFSGKSGSLHFWKPIPSRNGLRLVVTGQPYRSTDDHKGLKENKEMYEQHSHGFVVPETKGKHFFAGVAAQTGFAHQRTRHDVDQCMGQLVVPVYDNSSGNEIFVGVIEFVTIAQMGSFATYFNLLVDLLKEEDLATKIERDVEIKVDYKGKKAKFLLSFASGINFLREELRMKYQRLNLPQGFEIKYRDSHNKTRSITTDNELQNYVAKLSSNKDKGIRMFIE